MTSSQAARRAARRRDELRHDVGDARIRRVIAARLRLNTARLAMTLPRRPVRGGDVHVRAIERLNAAFDARHHLSDERDAAQEGPDERAAAVAFAAANEQVAAREAWLKYIEQGS
jgi:hypothetical protein